MRLEYASLPFALLLHVLHDLATHDYKEEARCQHSVLPASIVSDIKGPRSTNQCLYLGIELENTPIIRMKHFFSILSTLIFVTTTYAAPRGDLAPTEPTTTATVIITTAAPSISATSAPSAAPTSPAPSDCERAGVRISLRPLPTLPTFHNSTSPAKRYRSSSARTFSGLCPASSIASASGARRKRARNSMARLRVLAPMRDTSAYSTSMYTLITPNIPSLTQVMGC